MLGTARVEGTWIPVPPAALGPGSRCLWAAPAELTPQAWGCLECAGTSGPWGQEAAGSPGLPEARGWGASSLPEPVVWSEPCPCPVLRTHWKSLDGSWYQPHMPFSKLQDSSDGRVAAAARERG